MAINERLKLAIEEIKVRNKITQKEIARQLGMNNAYFSGVINGKYPFANSLANKISELFQIEIIGDCEETLNDSIMYAGGGDENDEMYTIPLLPISAQGGTLNDFVVSVKNSDCERVISPVKGADFAMSVAGDSMAPEYPSGSQVLIKKINERAFIDWGKVYVLDTCNGTIIKRLMPTDKKERVKCVSINPEYPPFEVDLSDVYGMYRVLLCMSIK